MVGFVVVHHDAERYTLLLLTAHHGVKCTMATIGAVQFYQQALTEEPEFAEALLNLGHALMSLGQEEEARSFWRRVIREKPQTGADLLRAGLVLLGLGKLRAVRSQVELS
jgi:tetratricopeptide (TPR) repeat protein